MRRTATKNRNNLLQIATKEYGGYVPKAMSGKRKSITEAMVVVAPNVPNKDAKRRIRKKDKCRSTHRFLHRLSGRIQIIISIQTKGRVQVALLFLLSRETV